MSKNIQPGMLCMIRGAHHVLSDGQFCDCGNGRIVEILQRVVFDPRFEIGWCHSPVACIHHSITIRQSDEAILFPIVDPDAVRSYDREHRFDDLDSDAVRERMLKMWSLS